MVRCLTFATQPRKCTTSSGLRMIGKVRGSGARHDLVEIPPPALEGNAVNQIAETATLIELASSFF